MSLTEKGQRILSAMQAQYGADKGNDIFYASRNAGTISGVDTDELPDALRKRFDSIIDGMRAIGERLDVMCARVEDDDDLSRYDADFNETDHPRDGNGKFGSGVGAATSEKTKVSKGGLKTKLEGMAKDKLHAALKDPNVGVAIKKMVEAELDDRASRGA